ncbi:hypothetical protein EXIGLDRAFT_838275 [Exidia glandulosa HHB12029]|uniref:F-box domain-containing protein n=1 Tax=Exidia glandulosa HHB12029 TaxID=1314781 RepID=A0A165G0X4_EXIGL|nr:hypothetical protein EXIGLDRAFT_838275 [Exidia glandulosa HHB12029]
MPPTRKGARAAPTHAANTGAQAARKTKPPKAASSSAAKPSASTSAPADVSAQVQAQAAGSVQRATRSMVKAQPTLLVEGPSNPQPRKRRRATEQAHDYAVVDQDDGTLDEARSPSPKRRRTSSDRDEQEMVIDHLTDEEVDAVEYLLPLSGSLSPPQTRLGAFAAALAPILPPTEPPARASTLDCLPDELLDTIFWYTAGIAHLKLFAVAKLSHRMRRLSIAHAYSKIDHPLSVWQTQSLFIALLRFTNLGRWIRVLDAAMLGFNEVNFKLFYAAIGRCPNIEVLSLPQGTDDDKLDVILPKLRMLKIPKHAPMNFIRRHPGLTMLSASFEARNLRPHRYGPGVPLEYLKCNHPTFTELIGRAGLPPGFPTRTFASNSLVELHVIKHSQSMHALHTSVLLRELGRSTNLPGILVLDRFMLDHVAEAVAVLQNMTPTNNVRHLRVYINSHRTQIQASLTKVKSILTAFSGLHTLELRDRDATRAHTDSWFIPVLCDQLRALSQELRLVTGPLQAAYGFDESEDDPQWTRVPAPSFPTNPFLILRSEPRP